MNFPPEPTPLLLPLLLSPPQTDVFLLVPPLATPPQAPLPPRPGPPLSSSFLGRVSAGPSFSLLSSSPSSSSSSSSFLKCLNYHLVTFSNKPRTNNYDNSICFYTQMLNILFLLLLFWNTLYFHFFPLAQCKSASSPPFSSSSHRLGWLRYIFLFPFLHNCNLHHFAVTLSVRT